MSIIQKQIDDEIERQIADAVNERDIEIINMIRKFRSQNTFRGEECSYASLTAFHFACDEIIRIIDSAE